MRSDESNTSEVDDCVRSNYDLVWTAAYCLTNRSKISADEITQDVFLFLLIKWDQLKKDNIKSWLIAVTRNKTLEYFRNEKRQRGGSNAQLDSDAFLSIPCIDSDLELSDNEIQKIKNELLDGLNETDRRLYNAYFEEGRSYEDIVRLFSMPLLTARSKIWRIRRKLYKELLKKGLLTFSAGLALWRYLTIIAASLFRDLS